MAEGGSPELVPFSVTLLFAHARTTGQDDQEDDDVCDDEDFSRGGTPVLWK